MEWIFSSELSVGFQIATWTCIPGDVTLHSTGYENLYRVQCGALRYVSWCKLVSYANCFTLRYIADLSWHAMPRRTSCSEFSPSEHRDVSTFGLFTHRVSGGGTRRHTEAPVSISTLHQIVLRSFAFSISLCLSLLYCVSLRLSH
jgi:hypothetical protein